MFYSEQLNYETDVFDIDVDTVLIPITSYTNSGFDLFDVGT